MISCFILRNEAEDGHYWPLLRIANLLRYFGDTARADRPALDTLGPWYQTTPIPGINWNLSLQLSYWPVYTANRLALGIIPT